MRQEIEHNFHKYLLSRNPGGVQASASRPPEFNEKLLVTYFLGGMCASASIGWCRIQNNILA
jgi:hypothetical protein